MRWAYVGYGFAFGVAAQLLLLAVGMWSSDPINWQRVWSSDPTSTWRGGLAFSVASWVPYPDFGEPPFAFKVLFWCCIFGSAGLVGVIAAAVSGGAWIGMRRLRSLLGL